MKSPVCLKPTTETPMASKIPTRHARNGRLEYAANRTGARMSDGAQLLNHLLNHLLKMPIYLLKNAKRLLNLLNQSVPPSLPFSPLSPLMPPLGFPPNPLPITPL